LNFLLDSESAILFFKTAGFDPSFNLAPFWLQLTLSADGNAVLFNL